MSGFGIYRDGSSHAHRLDPRTKVTAVLLLIIAGFLAKGWIALCVLAVLSLILKASSRMSVLDSLRMLRPFLPLMFFIGLFDALFVASGEVWWSAGPVSVSSGGLFLAGDCLVRFACVLMGTSVLMRVTSPTELSDAARLMLAPFEKLGLNVNSLSLALGMTLRFIPVFADELDRVKEAQEARHARFDQGGVYQRLMSNVALIVPLFAGAFRRSYTISCAVANRGFGVAGVRRTSYRSYQMQRRDAFALAVCVALAVCCIVMGFVLA